MTMKTDTKIVPAGKFKAECLAILNEVHESGESVVVTKRGKPVAIVVPYREKKAESLRKSVTFHGDVIGPILDRWDVER
jgi:prevent-host-death family protein